jgi:hypothetical protein
VYEKSGYWAGVKDRYGWVLVQTVTSHLIQSKS